MPIIVATPKLSTGATQRKRNNDGSLREQSDQDRSPLEAAAEDLLRAIDSKDSAHLALALRAAFRVLDSEPHIEGTHLNKEIASNE